jgi:glycine dehydrogenase subunit 1
MYIPHSEAERDEMLAAIGIDKIDALFEAVPEKFRFPNLRLDPGRSEYEVEQELKDIAKANLTVDEIPCFLGAGAYKHIIPAAVDAIISRSEFYTAYTPYQPEISQGTLQSIFEFQTLIARLTGMEAANASHYDGATACAEAGILALHHHRGKRSKILVSAGLNPMYRSTMRTYLQGLDGTKVESPQVMKKISEVSPDSLIEAIDEDTSLVMIQVPDFFGQIWDYSALVKAAHEKGALVAVCANPIALALLKSPGSMDADIVVGEGQPLGMPLSFGGPYLGFFAVRKELVRKMSGRIVGETVDARGQRGYVLTLTAREQHIRREKATSNICSNQGLNALTAAVYMSLMGKKGMQEVAQQCYEKAHYAARKISKIRGYKIVSHTPFFHEFAVRCPIPAFEVDEMLLNHGILGGLDLGRLDPALEDTMLFAVTEANTREEIDDLCAVLAEVG